MATVDDKKIIFSMVGVSKTIEQTQKQVLKNIYLSFFYGAKIGIIGLNGSGKSTLMKIIAGLDQKYIQPHQPHAPQKRRQQQHEPHQHRGGTIPDLSDFPFHDITSFPFDTL